MARSEFSPRRQEKELFTPEHGQTTLSLVNAAKKDALIRLPDKAEVAARERVTTAIENRFGPYIEESKEISRQLNTEEYQSYIREIDDFLDVTYGSVVCPDGRILAISFFDPRVGRINRRLAGMPDVRRSTEDAAPVLDDPTISAAIGNAIIDREEAGGSTDVVEFIGPHISSENPDHGCGATKGKVTGKGRPAKTAMKYGGIYAYFDELGDEFVAFDTVAKRAGGTGWTFDMTHDAYSQGLIFGLKKVYDEKNKHMFDPQASLRENLKKLHENGNILMTELLDERFEGAIIEAAQVRGITQINSRDPKNLAENVMTIGHIAKEITQQEEESGFDWIPQHLRTYHNEFSGEEESKPANVIRTLAYHAIRNSVYRILSGIPLGEHDLLEHPEQLIRVGPVGAAYNVETIPFIQVTPDGELKQKDVDGVKKLYGLSEGILPELGVDFEKEGRVIVTTGEHDTTIYRDPKIANSALLKEKKIVQNNAAKLRDEFSEGIPTGDTVIIGVVYEKNTAIAHIV